jgi:hypothetical protein
MSELLPVNKISETRSLICFFHPQPFYPVHILLVPKKDIRDLSQLDPMDDEFLADIFSTVRMLIKEMDLEKKGYRLIVNGGGISRISAAAFPFGLRWVTLSAVRIEYSQYFVSVIIAYIHRSIIL